MFHALALPGKIAPTSSLKPLPTPRVMCDLSAARPLMCVIMWYITTSQMWLWAPWVWGLIHMCVCVWWLVGVVGVGVLLFCRPDSQSLYSASLFWHLESSSTYPGTHSSYYCRETIGELRSPPPGSWPTSSAQSTHLMNHLPDPLP